MTTDMVQNGLVDVSHDAETTKTTAPAMANVRDCTGRRVHPTAAKPSRDAEAPVHHATVKSRALPRVDLCHLHPCSTQLLYRHYADCLLTSRNPALHTCPSIKVGARFLPSTWVEVMPVPSCLQVRPPRHAPRPSQVPYYHPLFAPKMNFSEDHIKQIFSLACEGRHLKERVASEFIRLSSQEVLFHTQVQSTGHESLANGRPDRFMTYYEILRSDQQSSEAKDKAMEEILDKVSQVWIKTNAVLFKHVLDYEAKLDAFLNKTGGWIREQEERIWMMMFEITGDAGALLYASLDIMLSLLDTLHSFPANLSYQSNSPIICGFAPKAYAQPWLDLPGVDLAHLPSFKSHKKAMDVLKEAISQSTGDGAVSRARAGPSASTSTAPPQMEKDANAPPPISSSVVHSPSKHRCAKSPSPQRSQSDTSYGEESASGHGSKGSQSSSSSSSRSSSESGSSSGSHEGSPARSEASAGTRSACSCTASIGSVEVLSGDEVSRDDDDDDDDALYSANEADVSQGSMSLLDISVSDDEDTCKCKVRELACKSNTDFAA